MKQLLCCSLLLWMTLPLAAQEKMPPQGPPKPPPVAERWMHDSSRIAGAVTLSATQSASVKTSFLAFYKSMDGLLEKSKPNPPAKEAVEALVTTRNNAVKKVLNAMQVKQYSGIERQLMPLPPRDKKGSPPPPSR